MYGNSQIGSYQLPTTVYRPRHQAQPLECTCRAHLNDGNEPLLKIISPTFSLLANYQRRTELQRYRIIKGFTTQDGDPIGTGEGGNIYGEPFKDKFHARLHYCRRDLIAGTNAGKMTILSNSSLLLHLHKNCRINIQSLGKSTHDHSTDPKLSSQPAVEPPGLANKERKEGRSSDWENDDEVKTQEELEFVKKEEEAMKKRIKDTLRDTKREPKKVQNYKIDDFDDDKGIKENE
ncbi:Peptidyl-prolyl cis-trans isomerase CWC27 like protein [Eufriesea mexicana]|uniref:Peptidyl-prolyl cis-trans isomerase CWC27 like protein n=1 Tax=Eufriesea mexicana TaxID=516756 RepID=A0A310SPP3_9HYME|nr:Peptidyl-prolyl cis-trans isomerase CWC27 like protein [Eufriesea mexicana]